MSDTSNVTPITAHRRRFFVNPKGVTRLYPWGEDPDSKQWWIDVKNDTSARDEQEIRAAGIPHMLQKPGQEGETDEQRQGREVKMGLDVGRMSLVRAMKYLIAWSLVDDEDGTPIPLTEQSVGELLPETFDAIDKALDAHKKVQAEKNGRGPVGANTSKSA